VTGRPGTVRLLLAVILPVVAALCPACAAPPGEKAEAALFPLSALFSAETLENIQGLRATTREDLADFQVITPGDGDPAVRAIYARPEGRGPFPAVLLNHGGFEGFSRSFLATARQWRGAGYAVAASEYRGEGDSGGRPDYAGGEVDDTLVLLDWLRSRPEVDPGKVALVGYSRGGTVALMAAARGAPAGAVVVYSALTDLEEALESSERLAGILERQDLPFGPGDREQLRLRSPIHRAGRIEAPVLLLHGEQDPLVPAAQSTAMAEAVREAGGEAKVLFFPEAAHHLKNYPGAFEAAASFLEARLDAPPARAASKIETVATAEIAVLEEADLPLPPARPYEGIRHGGIYQRMSYKDVANRVKQNLKHPLLAGIDFNAPWAMLEPEPDRYDWSWVDRPLEIWGKAGKRCVVNIVTMSPRGASPVAGHATPGWVFRRGAKKVTVETRGHKRTAGMTSDYPLLSDPVYLKEYEDLVAAFAARYDGHPALDAVGIGVGKLGGLTLVDPKISGGERQAILAFYDKNGYDSRHHFETIKRIALIYRRHFKETPVRLQLSNFFDKKDVSARNLAWFSTVGDWAASQGVNLFYQGFTGGPKYAQKMKNKPIDQIYHRNASKVLTGGELVDPVKRPNPSDFMGPIGRNVDNALGLTPGLERTHISWLNFYAADCRASNPFHEKFDPEWYRAFHKAYGNLRLVGDPGE